MAPRHGLPRRAQGIILHYDLKVCRGGHSDSAIVINLRVPLDRVIRQLTDRETKKFANFERDQRRLLWQLPALKLPNLFSKSFARALRLHTPYRKSRYLQRLEVKVRAFEVPGRLEEVYS